MKTVSLSKKREKPEKYEIYTRSFSTGPFDHLLPDEFVGKADTLEEARNLSILHSRKHGNWLTSYKVVSTKQLFTREEALKIMRKER